MSLKAFGPVTLFALVLLSAPAVRGQDDKPLEPGWLSLDGSVGLVDKSIADGKGALEKALGVSIAGYLDTSYLWSSNHPKDPRNISGRYFDKDSNKIVFNNFHVMVDKPEKDWGVGFHLSGDFGRYGELLREATLWGSRLQDEPSAELREAYVTTTIPIGEGIGVKGGLFVTTLGTEILNAPGAYNDNISRSFAFNFGVPLRHLGMLFSYPFAKTFTANAGIVTGWDNPRDNNSSPSVLGGISFTPMDSFALASNIIYGPEQTHNDGRPRITWSTVATIKPVDPLTMLLEYTLGGEDQAPTPIRLKDSYWHALAAIASYGWTDRFSTALRGEVFFDNQAARTFGLGALRPVSNATLGEVTLTGSYKFTKMFIGRLEFRQDWANHGVYKKGSTNADGNQTTLGAQLLYTF
jgi:hypothetical protein